jgi:hypothetical protein
MKKTQKVRKKLAIIFLHNLCKRYRSALWALSPKLLIIRQVAKVPKGACARQAAKEQPLNRQSGSFRH